MEFIDGVYNEYDKEAIKILDGFLPDKIFDAHMHILTKETAPNMSKGDGFDRYDVMGYPEFIRDSKPLFGNREVRANMIVTPDKAMADRSNGVRAASTAFLAEQLELHKGNVGEIIVLPDDTVEDIEKQLIHKNICGFKCYHVMAKRNVTWHASIGEFLPEAAWQVANERGLSITLHMVRDGALSDPENMEYIITMAKKYPNAVLILAHAARAFAAWTAIEAVEKLAPYDNVWFDFAAVCESPAMLQIIKKIGTKRILWATDYPVSVLCGKAISLADSFYWIGAKDLKQFAGPTVFHSWLVGTENLMATRQACLLADLKEDAVEDLFYRNAMRLFRPEK